MSVGVQPLALELFLRHVSTLGSLYGPYSYFDPLDLGRPGTPTRPTVGLCAGSLWIRGSQETLVLYPKRTANDQN